MPPFRGSALLLLLACASALAGDGSPPEGGPGGAPERRLPGLVWAAVDAPEADAPRALRDLEEVPGVSWSGVAEILRAGRGPNLLAKPEPPCTDPEAFAAYWERFPWAVGEVRRYDLGSDARYWYSVELPEGYDGTREVPVWFDFGLFSEGAPPGFARVRLNELVPGSLSLGPARVSMTAGYAVQSMVLSVVADLERRFRADRDRVFCGGFSRFGNMTWFEGLHAPDLWAGIVPAAGYLEFEDALLPNLRHVAVLAAWGTDPGHKAANQCTSRAAGRLAAAKHPDVTTHAGGGRAIDGLGDVFLRWVAERRRVPLPLEFTYVLTDPRQRGAYWAEITAVKSTGNLRTVVIGAPGDDGAERFAVNTRPASVAVQVTAPDAVVVRATNVAELRLFLSPDLFDLTKPLRVTCGGRTTPVAPAPSVATLIANFRRNGDPRRLFPAEITIRP